MEVEALDDGVMASIAVAEGTEGVAVGTVIAEIIDEGEESQMGAVPEKASDPSPVSTIGETNNNQGADAKVVEARSAPLKAEAFGGKFIGNSGRILASPLAKRIASNRGIDLAAITGTGPKGRIVKRDVEGADSAPVKATMPSSAMSAVAPAQAGSSKRVENSQMRMIIADRLQQSKQEAPHFYLNMDIDIGAMLDARKALNAHAPDGVKISVNDMIIKAAAIALKRVPNANASWEGTHTRLWNTADISVAVAIEGGLVTPIIAAAEDKGLNAISTEMADLASRARQGKLMPEEYTGGSFTISNLGMFGITSFSVVINPPQGAILAVGRGRTCGCP